MAVDLKQKDIDVIKESDALITKLDRLCEKETEQNSMWF